MEGALPEMDLCPQAPPSPTLQVAALACLPHAEPSIEDVEGLMRTSAQEEEVPMMTRMVSVMLEADRGSGDARGRTVA